jgi:hypothetical protein
MALMNVTLQRNGELIGPLFDVESIQRTDDGLRIWYHPDFDHPDKELYENVKVNHIDTGDPFL